MRVLSIEDDETKRTELRKLAVKVNEQVLFVEATNMASAMEKLQNVRYDLIILDLMVPMVQNAQPADVGGELVNIVSRMKQNTNSNIVALTAYRDLFDSREEAFAAAGVFLIHYEKESENWKPTILSLLRRSAAVSRCDFLILCALELEREALRESRATVGRSRIENGMDSREVSIGRYSGRAIGLPRSGLVNAAAITTMAVERFQPKVVAMTGICAGMLGRSELGQVLVCERCWEYQVGKYVEGQFQFEPYQVVIEEALRQELTLLCRSQELLEILYEGFPAAVVKKCYPKMATLVSGSAVIADTKAREEIRKQHRNIDGIEMELSAVFRAIELLDSSIHVIGAKAVADFANEQKGDAVQNVAAVTAGRFVVETIEKVLNRNS